MPRSARTNAKRLWRSREAFRKDGGKLPLRAADANEERVCKRATPRVGHRAELHAEPKRSACEADIPRDDATCHGCRGQMKPSN
jgi:hypothetical protein